MKKPSLLITTFITVILSLSITQVVISNGASTVGIKLGNIQSEIETYRKENDLMEAKILDAASLISVEKKAKELGFVQPKTQIYLSNPMPLALR